MRPGEPRKLKSLWTSSEIARGHEPVARLDQPAGATRFEAVHWSTIGALTAPDDDILEWARQHQFVVITNDLDFAAILAATSGKRRASRRSGLKTSCRTRLSVQ